MDARLVEKTDEYEQLLADACQETNVAESPSEEVSRRAHECLEMATAYLADGRHFQTEHDYPNALAAFAYGHGWLDAGIRLGVLDDHAGE